MRYHGRMTMLVDPHATHGIALHAAKLAMRNRLLAARDALSPRERSAASAAIVARIEALPSFQAARTLLLILPFRSEWDSVPLVRGALAAGKMVCLPRVDADARMLAIHRIDDVGTDTREGYRGIPEPLSSRPSVDAAALDWVLVPGVAFDLQGHRLGYGGGFYDRLLPLVARDAPRIGACYALQVIEAVPWAPHDALVDALVTERETVAIARG